MRFAIITFTKGEVRTIQILVNQQKNNYLQILIYNQLQNKIPASTKTSNFDWKPNNIRIEKFHDLMNSMGLIFFFHQGFLSQTLTILQGKGGEQLLFHSTTSTHSQNLLANLHVKWLSHIFNRKAMFTKLLLDEIYHLIKLPFEWLIDWWCNVCLFTS